MNTLSLLSVLVLGSSLLGCAAGTSQHFVPEESDCDSDCQGDGGSGGEGGGEEPSATDVSSSTGNTSSSTGEETSSSSGNQCVPKTCHDIGDTACGIADDGCGGSIDCGDTCSDGASCGGGNPSNVDGTQAPGNPNHCGGGCFNAVQLFECPSVPVNEKPYTPVFCSDDAAPPAYDCTPGIWNGNAYQKCCRK